MRAGSAIRAAAGRVQGRVRWPRRQGGGEGRDRRDRAAECADELMSLLVPEGRPMVARGGTSAASVTPGMVKHDPGVSLRFTPGYHRSPLRGYKDTPLGQKWADSCDWF